MQNVHISVNSAHFSPIFICILPQNIDFPPKNAPKMVKKTQKHLKTASFANLSEAANWADCINHRDSGIVGFGWTKPLHFAYFPRKRDNWCVFLGFFI
jgi:hypothetical protein